MFEHLEDPKLLYDVTDFLEEAPADDQTLILSFVPLLRGRLTICSIRADLSKDAIDPFGGIQFCYMDISDVEGVRLLLGAAAEIFETLRSYPTDPRGKDLSPNSARGLSEKFTGISHESRFEFSLSRNQVASGP